MLDVHPPHEPVHGWRDFFLHIATITIGLLIALGLEASVEWLHHRHLVTEARHNIHAEVVENQQLLPRNLAHLQQDELRLRNDIKIIRELRDNPRAKHDPLSFDLGWSSFSGTAFHTARDTGALAYMPSEELGELSTIYSQQDYINELGTALFTAQGRAPSILASETKIEDLQLEQLAQLMTRTTDLLAEVSALENGLTDLAKKYDEAAKLESR